MSETDRFLGSIFNLLLGMGYQFIVAVIQADEQTNRCIGLYEMRKIPSL